MPLWWKTALASSQNKDWRDRGPSADNSTDDYPTRIPLCNRCTKIHWAADPTITRFPAHGDALGRGAPPGRRDPAPHGWYFSPGWECRRTGAASAPGFCEHPSWGAHAL